MDKWNFLKLPKATLTLLTYFTLPRNKIAVIYIVLDVFSITTNMPIMVIQNCFSFLTTRKKSLSFIYVEKVFFR